MKRDKNYQTVNEREEDGNSSPACSNSHLGGSTSPEGLSRRRASGESSKAIGQDQDSNEQEILGCRRISSFKKENPQGSFSEKSKAVLPGRFPRWLHRKLPVGGALMATRKDLSSASLATVCEEANCPNLLECYAKRCATFLAMGRGCTRACPFCSIDFSKKPEPLDETEPMRIAEMAEKLGLSHVVVTMVTRDDLPDGGASFLVKIMEAVRMRKKETTIELLTSDFQGNFKALQLVLDGKPEIFNHNIETVRSLTPRVRHKATYERSLSLLRYAKAHGKNLFVKSGFMVGLGENMKEVKETIFDLFSVGCDIITIGQYLQPEKTSLKVVEFASEEKFEEMRKYGESLGVRFIFAHPFVRSSYNAATLFHKLGLKAESS